MDMDIVRRALTFLGFQLQDPDKDPTDKTKDMFGSTMWAEELVYPENPWIDEFLGVFMRTTQSGGHYRYFAYDSSCWYDLDSLNRVHWHRPLLPYELLTYERLLHPTAINYMQDSEGRLLRGLNGELIADGESRFLPNIQEVMSPHEEYDFITFPYPRTSKEYRDNLDELTTFHSSFTSIASLV